MKITEWFRLLSSEQRIGFVLSLFCACAIAIAGALWGATASEDTVAEVTVQMSIKKISSLFNETGKAFARELNLPLDCSKTKPLSELGVTKEQLDRTIEHFSSHRDAKGKYYVYGVLVVWGLGFLIFFGRPRGALIDSRKFWFPQTIYIAALAVSVAIAGFYYGKSPNPMEAVVKVFKSFAGLYADPIMKILLFLFFIILALVGNKLICGWACPFGALQELIHGIVPKKLKKLKPSFLVSNTIRTILFLIMILLLFGLVGDKKGFVLYHNLNPFNLFNFDFETPLILITIVGALLLSLVVYRPFCHFVCPFGLVSWLAERLSFTAVVIDLDKCIRCGLCERTCPGEAATGILNRKKLPADCFSCARCLNVCPVDAIKYTSRISFLRRKKQKIR